jgi:DNA-binding transcriptional regulator YiaG
MTPASFIAWRARLHLNVVAAAKALGCSRRAIQSWEAGRTKIPRYIALAAAAVAHGLPEIYP